MKNIKILAISVLAMAVFSCKDNDKTTETSFKLDGAVLKEQYKEADQVELQVLNPGNESIDSIVYYLNGKTVGSVKGTGKVSAPLRGLKLGYHTLKASVFSDGKSTDVTERIELVSSIEPELLKYSIVNVFPHDIRDFTQGLEFYRDTLYESTGQHGASILKKYDYKTGRVFKQVDLEQQYFGEGITIINGKVYQLTYKSLVGFIYDADTFKREKTFNYDKQIEGWGMTNDGQYIYQSDGSEKIWKMDPNTQKLIDFVNVYSPSGKIKSVNELEYIDGKFYGNIWMRDAIAVIDPQSGAVEGILNLADLRKQIQSPNADVLNGIAWNPKTKTLFVTGKNWDKLFELKLGQ